MMWQVLIENINMGDFIGNLHFNSMRSNDIGVIIIIIIIEDAW